MEAHADMFRESVENAVQAAMGVAFEFHARVVLVDAVGHFDAAPASESEISTLKCCQ